MKKLTTFACKPIVLLVMAVFVVTLSSYSRSTTQDVLTQDPFGFWNGLWHGIVIPIRFVVSLFKDGIEMYDIHNNGGWYDTGFFIGIAVLFAGSEKAACGKHFFRVFH